MSENVTEEGVLYEPKPEFIVQIGEAAVTHVRVGVRYARTTWEFESAHFSLESARSRAKHLSMDNPLVRVVTREVAGL